MEVVEMRMGPTAKDELGKFTRLSRVH